MQNPVWLLPSGNNGVVITLPNVPESGAPSVTGSLILGIDPAVTPGYEKLQTVVRIKGSGTPEEFAEIHQAVLATSPNFHNVSRPVALGPALVVE